MGLLVKVYLGQEDLYHQVHAANVEVHGEIPVCLFAVQDGPMMDKPRGDIIKCQCRGHARQESSRSRGTMQETPWMGYKVYHN